MTSVIIFGQGAVGSALGNALRLRCGHLVAYHDPPRGVRVTDADFGSASLFVICVPTAFDSADAYGFDSTPLRDALSHCPAGSQVAIKSTIPPGTTEALQLAFPELFLFFVPEFLTEATAERDAYSPARTIVGYTPKSQKGASGVLDLFPNAPVAITMPATEAELVKYFSNALYAVKVAFANQIYDLCTALGADYEMVRQAASADPMIAPYHLDVHHGGYRGFGGKCLPKDLITLVWTMCRRGLSSEAAMLTEAIRYNEALHYNNAVDSGSDDDTVGNLARELSG